MPARIKTDRYGGAYLGSGPRTARKYKSQQALRGQTGISVAPQDWYPPFTLSGRDEDETEYPTSGRI